MKNIKLFLTDCDGVLTDAGMYYFDNGLEAKKFNTRDGMGFAILKEKGIKTGIVTGENTNIVKNRATKLKMDYLYMGASNKKDVLEQLCNETKIKYEDVVYVGDDINDIEILKIVGFPCCPNDACDEVKKVSKYVCDKNGGEGVIREIVNKYFNGVDSYE